MNLSIGLDDTGVRRAIASAPARMASAVELAIQRAAMELAREARRRAPKAFSTLTNSILPTRVAPLHWRVSTGTNYARSVEEGRLPGQMPGTSKGLMEWVRFRTGLTGKPLDRATFVIARAIGRRGIKPANYMLGAFEATEDRIRDLVRSAATREAEAIFRG